MSRRAEPGRCWERNRYSRISLRPSVDPSRAGGEPGATCYLLQPFSWVFFSTSPTNHHKPFKPAIVIKTFPQKLSLLTAQGCSQCPAATVHTPQHPPQRQQAQHQQHPQNPGRSLVCMVCCCQGSSAFPVPASPFCISHAIYYFSINIPVSACNMHVVVLMLDKRSFTVLQFKTLS